MVLQRVRHDWVTNTHTYSGVLGCASDKEPIWNAGDTREAGVIPGSEKFPGEGNGNPLQYSYLGNSMEKGSWWAAVHGAAESGTTEQLSASITHTHTHTQNTHIFRLLLCLLHWYWSEEAMTPHSSTLAWKIPWAEEPGRQQSMGSRRVGHDWATSLSLFTFLHWRRQWQPTPVFLPGKSQGRGAWWAAVYGVAQSRTRLKRLSSSSSIDIGKQVLYH